MTPIDARNRDLARWSAPVAFVGACLLALAARLAAR